MYGGDEQNWDAVRVPLDEKNIKSKYRYHDRYGQYRTGDLTGAGTTEGESGAPWRGFDPTVIGRHWAVPKTGEYARYLDEVLLPGYLRIERVHHRLDALADAEMIHYSSRKGGMPSLKRYLRPNAGQLPGDLWTDIEVVNSQAKERTGYPTQKPLALYERIIQASSNEGDMVLDPFCGCATTPVAAERLGRQWVGMDIWDGAVKIVRQRMEDNRQLLADPDPQIHYSTRPAQRTDENEVAAPFLKLKMQRELEPWQRLRHAEIVEHLVEAQNSMGLVICAGCGRVLEREFMQLDHINPRAQGGANDITNRILLCGPCNGRKGADYTLIGLVRRNRRDKWMQNADRARLAQDSARQKAEQVQTGQVI